MKKQTKPLRAGSARKSPVKPRATASTAGRRERTPREATTYAQQERMKRDNVVTARFWMLLDEGEVVICEQRRLCSPTAKIRIPRATFNRFIDWYNTGKWR